MLDQEFERIGKRLFSEGLIGGNFGNMSVKDRGSFHITQTGCYLDDPGSPIKVPIIGQVPQKASSEYRVHRAIYLETQHTAIVHAHPAHAVAVSLLTDEIVPEDSEGQMLCPTISVVSAKPGSKELAQEIGSALQLRNVVIARGHGTFAAASSLDEAYLFTSLAEHACRVLVLKEQYRRDRG